MDAVVFEVEGRPVPQGSMTASYNRKTETAHVHHVQGAALAAWRASIRKAAREHGARVLAAPVAVTVSFGMTRPKEHMRLVRGEYAVKVSHLHRMPDVAPDLDKLVRALLDALTGVCYADDRQVVRLHAEKVYRPTTLVKVEPVVTRPQLSFELGEEAPGGA